MFQTKVVEKIKIHIFLLTIYIYIYMFFENPAFYEIMWEKTIEPDRPQMTK